MRKVDNERMTGAKWLQMPLILMGRCKPDARLKRFTDFDPEQIREDAGKRLWAILLDIDGCVAAPEGNDPKPAKKAFVNACQQFGFQPMTTWMVGDNPMTDGGASTNDALKGLILIDPIKTDWSLIPTKKLLKMGFNIAFRRLSIAVTLKHHQKTIFQPNTAAK